VLVPAHPPARCFPQNPVVFCFDFVVVVADELVLPDLLRERAQLGAYLQRFECHGRMTHAKARRILVHRQGRQQKHRADENAGNQQQALTALALAEEMLRLACSGCAGSVLQSSRQANTKRTNVTTASTSSATSCLYWPSMWRGHEAAGGLQMQEAEHRQYENSNRAASRGAESKARHTPVTIWCPSLQSRTIDAVAQVVVSAALVTE